MEFTDWLLALHLLSAAFLVSALVVFTVLIVAGWKTDVPSAQARMMGVAKGGTVAVTIGSLGAIIFGVWLAIDIDGYKVWDGWVLAAIIMWAIAVETGRRGGEHYNALGKRAQELVAAGNDAPDAELGAMARSSKGVGLHAVTFVLVLLILVDMIWKPGA
jgi:hypothetical protein